MYCGARLGYIASSAELAWKRVPPRVQPHWVVTTIEPVTVLLLDLPQILPDLKAGDEPHLGDTPKTPAIF